MRCSVVAAVVFVALAVVTSCGDDESSDASHLGQALASTDVSELENRAGCGRFGWVAWDIDERVTLIVDASEWIASQELVPPTSVSTTMDLPDPLLDIRVAQGTNMAGAECTDAAQASVVEREWTALGGTAQLTIDVAAGSGPGFGSIRLFDVLFESDGTELAPVSIEWEAALEPIS